LPEVGKGDSVGRLLTERFQFEDGDVLVVAQKIISKSEGRVVSLAEVTPGAEAVELASRSEKDSRLVQLILDESRSVLRVRPGLIIVEDRRGWVCANAGIDRSNVLQRDCNSLEDEWVCLLPADPDESARRLREDIMAETGKQVGVIINDSHGRAWRDGTVGVAIGAAGITVKSDRRGAHDRHGYVLQHTIIGTADELAAAGSLLMGQAAEGVPVVVIRGVSATGEGTAAELQRPKELDLFR
jgi:coenzyme F420-0:L-glutamate ligase/coenzyme F420-1:gamma-L-glutamate ligase